YARSAAGGRPAEDAARVEAAPGRADPDPVAMRDEVVDGQFEFAEPLVKRADRLLRPLGPALEPALVLDRVGCHELVADICIAAGEAFLEESPRRCDVS